MNGEEAAGSQSQVEMKEGRGPRALGPSFIPELQYILPLEPRSYPCSPFWIQIATVGFCHMHPTEIGLSILKEMPKGPIPSPLPSLGNPDPGDPIHSALGLGKKPGTTRCYLVAQCGGLT